LRLKLEALAMLHHELRCAKPAAANISTINLYYYPYLGHFVAIHSIGVPYHRHKKLNLQEKSLPLWTEK